MGEGPVQRPRGAIAGAISAGIDARPLGSSWPPCRGAPRSRAGFLERRTPFPWIAVAFGLGILLFFQAEGRPALWAPVAGFLLATAAAVALRGRVLAFGIAVGCAAVFAGFTAGLLRLDAVRRRCSTGAYRQAHRIRRERRGAP
jgi:competence protein ComEC